MRKIYNFPKKEQKAMTEKHRKTTKRKSFNLPSLEIIRIIKFMHKRKRTKKKKIFS